MYCFAAGAALLYASNGLPRQVYAALGGRNSLPVMLGEAIVIALLLALLAVLWGYLTLRPMRRTHRPYLAWLMAGIGVAWAGWLMAGAFSFALKPKAYSAPLQTMLLSSNAAPLFGIFNIIGVLAGAWVAGRLAVKHQLSLPVVRSRRHTSSLGAPSEEGQVSTLPPPA